MRLSHFFSVFLVIPLLAGCTQGDAVQDVEIRHDPVKMPAPPSRDAPVEVPPGQEASFELAGRHEVLTLTVAGHNGSLFWWFNFSNPDGSSSERPIYIRERTGEPRFTDDSPVDFIYYPKSREELAVWVDSDAAVRVDVVASALEDAQVTTVSQRILGAELHSLVQEEFAFEVEASDLALSLSGQMIGEVAVHDSRDFYMGTWPPVEYIPARHMGTWHLRADSELVWGNATLTLVRIQPWT